MCPLVVKIQFEHIKKAIKVFHNKDDLLENSKVHIGPKNWEFRVPKGAKKCFFFTLIMSIKTIFLKDMT